MKKYIIPTLYASNFFVETFFTITDSKSASNSAFIYTYFKIIWKFIYFVGFFVRLPTPPRAAVENVQKSDFSPEKADKSLNFFLYSERKFMLIKYKSQSCNLFLSWIFLQRSFRLLYFFAAAILIAQRTILKWKRLYYIKISCL